MTVGEMLDKRPSRRLSPLNSLFTVNHPSRGEIIACVSDFLLQSTPGMIEWDVVKETLTKEELDDWCQSHGHEEDSTEV